MNPNGTRRANEAGGPASVRGGSWRAALLIVALTATMAAVLIGLLNRPGRSERTQPYLGVSRISDGWMALSMEVRPLDEGRYESAVRLEADGDALASARAVTFTFVPPRLFARARTEQPALPIDAAVFESEDGRFRFEAGPTRLREGRPVRLIRQDAPAAVEGTTASPTSSVSTVTLRLIARDAGWPFAVACRTGEGNERTARIRRAWLTSEPRIHTELERPTRLATPVPIGSFVGAPDERVRTRAALLAFMWELPGTGTVWWLAGVVTAGFGCGLALLARASGRVPGSPGMMAWTGGGVALVFLAWTAAYALVSPPLHGPDEADHLMSFERLAGAEDLRATLPEYARRVHFDRMRVQPWERFASGDVERPYAAASQEWFPGDVRASERSGVGALLWKVFAAGLPRESHGRLLLGLRLCQGLVLACLVGWAAALAAGGVTDGRSALLGLWPVLLFPRVPILGAAASNYFLLVGAGVLMAVAMTPARGGARREIGAALAMGLSLSLGWFSSRNGLSLIGMLPLLGVPWLAAAFGRGPVDGRTVIRRWGALGVGLLLPWFAASSEYRENLASSLGLPGVDGSKFGLGMIPYPLALVVAMAMGAGLETGLLRGRRSLEGMARFVRRAAVAGACLAAAVLVVVTVVGPWIDWPEVRTSGRELSKAGHVVRGGLALLGSLGVAGRDYRLWGTFWDVVGSVDVLLPGWVIAGFSLALSLGLAAAWVRTALRGEFRALTLVTLAVIGSGLTLGLLLLGGRSVGFVLMGRYLIVVYCVLFTAAAAGWLPAIVAATRRWPAIAWPLVGALPLAIHGLGWALILDCYF